jgi:hypothetical protein
MTSVSCTQPSPESDPSPDPLTLYAGAPTPAHLPSVAALARAYAHFRSHYRADDPEHRVILDGAARAFTALQERVWTVLPDGSLEIAGSQGDVIYQVTDAACRQKDRMRRNRQTGRLEPALCPSFLFAQRRHGGACYHVIARELLRLAQVIETQSRPAPAPDPASDLLPFVSLTSRLLGLALGIARLPEQPVTLTIEGAALLIHAGHDPVWHISRLTCDEGRGAVSLRLAAPAFRNLWDGFRPEITRLDLVLLFIDPRTAHVLLYGDQFAARSQGVIVRL